MGDQQKYTSKLNGTRILVIGGTSGIGFSVAEAMIEHGAVRAHYPSPPSCPSVLADRDA